MPELPEVETIRLGLLRHVLNKKIRHVDVRKAKIVRGSAKEFVAQLTGAKFTGIERRGKLLIFTVATPGVAKGVFILVHLKMTGQLIYEKGRTLIAGGHTFPQLRPKGFVGQASHSFLPNKYSHVVIEFAGGGTLFFNDMRQFGYMQLVDQVTLEKVLALYGPEPLAADFSFDVFSKVLGKRSISIKAALLNQQIIAGIGNIYADESCFYAGIRPTRKVKSLSQTEKKALFAAIVQVLKKAMKYGGTTFSNFRDVEGGKGNFTRLLKAYGRGGLQCLRCTYSPLKRSVVAGRGTVWCPNCQK